MTDSATFPSICPPDPDTIFVSRAARFRELAQDHVLAPFLLTLAELATVQDAVRIRKPAPRSWPISASDFNDPDFHHLVQTLLEAAGGLRLSERTEHARLQLLGEPPHHRKVVAEQILRGDAGTLDAGAAFFMALALQAFLVPLAASSHCETSDHSALLSTCPCCGRRPVASVIVGGSGQGLRYCCCGLCGTQWHHLRATCTNCGEARSLSYCAIEDQGDDVSAECCEACGTYLKHFRLDRQPVIVPFADDIASLALDMKMRETPYKRITANPLLSL